MKTSTGAVKFIDKRKPTILLTSETASRNDSGRTPRRLNVFCTIELEVSSDQQDNFVGDHAWKGEMENFLEVPSQIVDFGSWALYVDDNKRLER